MGSVLEALAQAETPRFSDEWWLTVGVSLGLILLFAVIVNVLARRYVRRLEDRAAALAEGTEREKLRQARRRATVAKCSSTRSRSSSGAWS